VLALEVVPLPVRDVDSARRDRAALLARKLGDDVSAATGLAHCRGRPIFHLACSSVQVRSPCKVKCPPLWSRPCGRH